MKDKEEEKDKERGRRKDHAKLLEERVEVQGRADPLQWASVFVSKSPSQQ